MCVILSYILTPTCSNMAYAYGSDYNGLTTLQYMYHVNELQFKTSQQWPVALFTKILTIKNCRKCKTGVWFIQRFGLYRGLVYTGLVYTGLVYTEDWFVQVWFIQDSLYQ